MTLHALRQTIGDDAFFRLLKEWIAAHAGGNVTIDQFTALAEQISGRELDAFFNTWLYTKSKPPGITPWGCAGVARIVEVDGLIAVVGTRRFRGRLSRRRGST